MRRLALPAVALVAALAGQGCASTEQFVAECRTYVGAWYGGRGGTEEEVMHCAEQRRRDRDRYTAETWAGLFLLPVVAVGAALPPVCQTRTQPNSRGGWTATSICY